MSKSPGLKDEDEEDTEDAEDEEDEEEEEDEDDEEDTLRIGFEARPHPLLENNVERRLFFFT